MSAFVFVCFINANAQVVGKIFPDMDTETVESVAVNLPGDGNGKFTLIGLAYSKKSEKDLNTWFNPIYSMFIHKPEKQGLFTTFSYDVNVFFIPMFTGAKAAAEGTAKKKAAKNVDPKLHPNLLFYKGKLKPYKEALGFDKKDVPYFFVLDADGKFVYATSGMYTEAKMDQIEEKLDQ